MKIYAMILVLGLVVLSGCNYITKGSADCKPPAVPMSDINGNVVCVITPESQAAVLANESGEPAVTIVIGEEGAMVENQEPALSDEESSMAEVPEETQAKTILEVARQDGRFTTLVDALDAADVAGTLEGEGPFTVFAPTDKAFKELPTETIVALLAEKETLADALSYSVLKGKIMADQLLKLDSAEALNGDMVEIDIDGDELQVNGIPVIMTDIEASNGVIHVIDGVLLPPGFNSSIIPIPEEENAEADENETPETGASEAAEEQAEQQPQEPAEPAESEPENTETEEEQDMQPPVTGNLPRKEVTAGELVNFPNLAATDPDGDPVFYTFSSPLDENGVWQTTADDAGEYIVTITASDGVNQVSQNVLIVVKAPNRPPVISPMQRITVKEGEVVKARPVVSDPDGDSLSVLYGDPLDVNGEWQTGEGDAGEYTAMVTVTDGSLQVTTTVGITVEPANTAPVMEDVADVTVNEGETVSFNPAVSDADGDDVRITYSGWMTTNSYTTGSDDAGTHIVTITASDGKDAVSQQVTVTVVDVNRPPVFDPGAFD